MSSLPTNGFEIGVTAAPALKHRHVALVQLIATLALALSTLIAATAVSIGFARADIAALVPAVEAPCAALALPPSKH